MASPHSSAGASFREISPGTAITAYSPDEPRAINENAVVTSTPPRFSVAGAIANNFGTPATQVAGSGSSKVSSNLGFSRSLAAIWGSSRPTNDPFAGETMANGVFVCGIPRKGAEKTQDPTKLSATASDFHPSQALLEQSVPDVLWSNPVNKGKERAKTPSTIGQPVVDYTLPRRIGAPFTTDVDPGMSVRRSFKITHIWPIEESLAFSLYNKVGVISEACVFHAVRGQMVDFYLSFDSLRIAEEAHNKARRIKSSWEVSYISPEELEANCPGELAKTGLPAINHAGQVLISAHFQGGGAKPIEHPVLRNKIIALVQKYGDYWTFEFLGEVNGRSEFRVEFTRITDSIECLQFFGKGTQQEACARNSGKAKQYTDLGIQGYLIHVQQYVQPSTATDISGLLTQMSISGPSETAQNQTGIPKNVMFAPNAASDSGTVLPYGAPPTPPSTAAPFGWFWSPTGRTRIPRTAPVVAPGFTFNGHVGAVVPQPPITPLPIHYPSAIGEVPAAMTPFAGSWSTPSDYQGSGHQCRRGGRGEKTDLHNIVHIPKILNGTDVRTTIMLRNIPNKMNLPELKGFVDRSSWGKYDFIYLRIDFQNECNVGYAFVNFERCDSIIAFFNDLHHKEWTEFRSSKIAEVSYATIQGRDCLIQKFRNSSVMQEYDNYRPKLYFTESDGDKCGEEAPFPPPDNPSKLKRSCDNAQHIGLFPPRGGNFNRDDRRRRSQFDRGTPRAQLEEFYDRRGNNVQSFANSPAGGVPLPATMINGAANNSMTGFAAGPQMTPSFGSPQVAQQFAMPHIGPAPSAFSNLRY
ncbi:MAG: hypothetical protein M1820_010649 [Bogoriella megaspora]|nr:MAG: hypothetical protein M1820_010649 [Bogoriella megaspora]